MFLYPGDLNDFMPPPTPDYIYSNKTPNDAEIHDDTERYKYKTLYFKCELSKKSIKALIDRINGEITELMIPISNTSLPPR